MSIDGRGSDCLAAGKLAPGNLGLLQQNRHLTDSLASYLGKLSRATRYQSRPAGSEVYDRGRRALEAAGFMLIDENSGGAPGGGRRVHLS
jgi:hypothetical protein